MSNGTDNKDGDEHRLLGSDDELESDIEAWGDLFDGLHDEDPAGIDARSGAADPLAAGGGVDPLTGKPMEAAPPAEPDAAAPEATDDVLGDLLSDDALEFIGEAHALGSMLGQVEPPPLADPDEPAGTPAPAPEPPPTPAVEVKPPVRKSAPQLTAAPSDDELFGNLPDEIPDPIAESARKGAAIVRREDLERHRAASSAEPASEFEGAEVTRMADANVMQGIADMAAIEEFERDRVTAEREVELALDEDFYDDIEIADSPASPPKPAAPAAPAKRPTARRINAHIARRHAPEPDYGGESEVVEIEAEPSEPIERPAAPPPKPTEVYSGTIGDGDDDDDGVISSGIALARPGVAPTPKPPPRPRHPSAREDLLGLDLDADPDPTPTLPRERGREPGPDPVAEPAHRERREREAIPESKSPEPELSLPTDTPLAAVDVAPELPGSKFDQPEPALDLGALSLPFESDPSPTAGADDAAALLAQYDRELALLDDQAAIAALRLEAGRLAELTGDLDAARAHFAAAADADPRSVIAAAAQRRTAYAADDAEAALAALETEISLASAAEKRGLAAWRADLMLASADAERATETVTALLEDAPDDLRALLAGAELAYAAGDADAFARRLEGLAAVVGEGALSRALQLVRGRALETVEDGTIAAVDAFQSVLRAAPTSRPATWGIERVALRAGRMADASAAAGRVLASGLAEVDPALAGAVALRRSRVARDAGDVHGYVEGLEAAAQLSPDDPAVLADLAAAYEARGSAPQAVRAYLTCAAKSAAASEQADAYRRAARLLGAGAGSPADTIEAVHRLFALDPDDSEAAATLQAALAESGDLEALLDLDRTAADADPDGGVFERVRIAKRLVAAGRVMEAVGELEAAYRAGAQSPVLADTLARTLGFAGRAEQRASLLEQLAASDSDHRDPEVAAIRAAQAAEEFAYELIGADTALSAAGPAALERAQAAWSRVLELDPESRMAHAALLRLAEHRDDPIEIVNALAAAQTATSDRARANGLALRRYALLLSGALPNPDAAEGVLREARSMSPEDPRTALALVVLLAGAGRWSDAVFVLEERAAALGSAPEAQALRFRGAAILHEHTDEASRLVEMLAPVVAAYPDFAPAAALLEAGHRKLGDTNLLTEDLERKLARTTTGGTDEFGILVREAELFEYQVGDPAKAAHLYAKALDVRAGDPLARDGFTRSSELAGESGPLSQLALDDLKHADDANDPRGKADAYEELARIDSELRGDPGSARFSYESAAKIDPARWPVLRALELAYLKDQRDADLARIYDWQVAATNHPADAIHVSLERVRTLTRSKRPAADVLREYKRAYELDQRCGIALLQLEAAARQRGPSDALAAFEEAAARFFDTDDRAKAAFLTRAGETRFALQDLEGAVDCFKAAIDALPGYLPAMIGWRRAALGGQLWLDVGESAERQAEHAHTDEERTALQHLAGVAYMDRAMSPERAIPALRRVLTFDPKHVDAYVRLRMLYEEQGAHDDLAQLLDQRLEVEDSVPHEVEIHHALAAIHADYLQNPDGARRHLRQALELDPKDGKALSELAEIAWNQGEWADASEALIARAQLETDPDALRDTLRRIGRIYADHLPDPQVAIGSYQRVLQLDPTDEEALDRLSSLCLQTQDFKRALGACERLLQNPQRTSDSKIEILHRVGEIYQRMDESSRAERAYRAALDVDPTSPIALDALVRFYRLGGDLRSLRVHLDTVAGAMRKRLTKIALDGTAYRVLSRVLATREEAGARGSLAAAICAAEMSVALGSGEDHDQRLAAEAAATPPAVTGFGTPEIDDVLVHRAVPNGLRQLLRALDERLTKATSSDLKRYGVGRGERLRGNEPLAQVAGQIAAQLGVDNIEVYVSQRVPNAVAAESGSSVKLFVGADLARDNDAARLRFVAGRALKLALSGMSVPARLDERECGALIVGLLRSFRPEFSPGGVDMGAVAEQLNRVRKVVPGNMLQQLGPYAMDCASVDFDHAKIWAGIQHTANRAGLVCSGSVQAGIQVLMQLRGIADVNAASGDPFVQELMRFSVSEDHVIVRRMIAEAPKQR
jgi:tetratricopeptide (TPR) repeat protein